MDVLVWQTTYETGIEEIDNQHKQLLDYLNQLGAVQYVENKEEILSVLDGLSDYTLSHFAFEEKLMEEAGYQYLGPHKHIHQMLIKKVVGFNEKLKNGEDIFDELHAFLRRWLINHIQRDDSAYVQVVRKHFQTDKDNEQEKQEPVRSGWLSRLAKKFFT